MGHRTLGKKCAECGCVLLDKNTTGRCRQHRDRNGKNNPFFGKHHTQETIDAIKKTDSVAIKQLWKSEEYRTKVINGTSKPRSIAGRKNISVGVQRSYQQNPNLKLIRGESMKRYWKDGRIVKNGYSCNKSKLQHLLFEELKQLMPKLDIREGQTLRTDDGMWLFPDILIKDKKVVVEFYGDYWHGNPRTYKSTDLVKGQLIGEIWKKDRLRVSILKKLGYKTLVVWQYDFKNNKGRTLERIQNVIN